MDRSSNGSGKLRSKITFQQMYLDSVSQGGHMGTLDEDKKFGNFKSKRPPLYLPDLSHCGIKSNLAPPIAPATRRDGKVLKQFKRDALAAGRHYAELETRLNNQRTFQSLNHVTYLNKIMVRICAFSMLLLCFFISWCSLLYWFCWGFPCEIKILRLLDILWDHTYSCLPYILWTYHLTYIFRMQKSKLEEREKQRQMQSGWRGRIHYWLHLCRYY